MIRFFWDMDGTLFDFDKRFKEVMPGIDIEDDDKWTWQQLHSVCPDIYRHLEVMPGMLEVYDVASTIGDNYVLTAIPRRWSWPDITKHKRESMLDHFPDMAVQKIRFGPYAEDKQFHCTGIFDVLIDDRIRNIEQWRLCGGSGIHHKSAEQTLYQIQLMAAIPKIQLRSIQC